MKRSVLCFCTVVALLASGSIVYAMPITILLDGNAGLGLLPGNENPAKVNINLTHLSEKV